MSFPALNWREFNALRARRDAGEMTDKERQRYRGPMREFVEFTSNQCLKGLRGETVIWPEDWDGPIRF